MGSWAILWLLVGIAVGAGALLLAMIPTFRMTRRLRETAEVFVRGNWRRRVEADRGASAEVRRLADLLNQTAERTRRQLKDLLRERGDLEALVDSLPDALLLADTRRKVIRINKPAAELLGVSRERALGESLEAAVSYPAVLAIFDEAAEIDPAAQREDGAPVFPLRRELRITRGGRRLAYQAVATRTAAGGVLLVLRDISTLDATLRMKTEFVANAGHELRTPIAAIKAAFETLGDVVQERSPSLADADRRTAERCLEIIAGQLQRLEEMLRDLLDLSRVESSEVPPTLERLTLAEVSRELRQSLGPAAAEKRITLQLPEGSDEAATKPFTSDRRLLMLALKNLVENGIRYTPDGGLVRMTGDWRGQEAAPGAPGPAAEGAAPRAVSGHLELQVTDTGVGIPPEHLDRIFERFYQVDPARTGTNPRVSGRGTGLGLSIVKHAASALGGSVSVASRLGVGSTFTLKLPPTREPPMGRPAIEESRSET